jgi:hypothetical protein
MLLSDISDTEIQASDIVRSRTAVRMVSGYAQLALSPFLNFEALANMKSAATNDLRLLANRAKEWMQQIAPSICDDLPRYIVAINNCLQEYSIKVLAAITGIANLQTVQQQRQVIDGFLNDLVNNINEQRSKTEDVYRKLKVFSILINDAKILLVQKTTEVEFVFADKAGPNGELLLLIEDDFVDIYGDDCCAVTTMPKKELLDKVDGREGWPNETSFIFCNAVLEKMTFHVRETESVIQRIFESWTVLQKKYSLVLTYLDNAPDDLYAQCLQQLNFDAAQKNWRKLVDAIVSFIK